MIINEKQLLLGDSYKINEHITIHNPTIGEVLDYGEEKYFEMISCLISNPYSCKVILHDAGIDYEEVSDFKLFCMMRESPKYRDTKIILGELNLSKFELFFNKETNEYVLWDSQSNIVIDQETYSVMVDCIKMIHCVNKQDIKPLDKKEKQYLIDKERYELELAMCRPFKPFLFPFFSDISNYRDIRMSAVRLLSDSQNYRMSLEQQEVS